MNQTQGELSILQSEITKMTLRIREQNNALRKEKEHSADSLADIAHQLRTPLTSVTLILSLLENNPEEGERKDLLRETEELLVRMDWLITSLLKLSRLDAGVVAFQTEQIEVTCLVRTALRPLLIPMELHDLTLQTDIPEGITISGDLSWLSEAVQNILKNCMESAGDGGRITIACTDTLLFTEITIRDSGPGFKKEDLPCLFDRFYRGKNSGAAGIWDWPGALQDNYHTAGRYDHGKKSSPGRCSICHPFPKVTNLSPESHKDVSAKVYYMGKFRTESENLRKGDSHNGVFENG